MLVAVRSLKLNKLVLRLKVIYNYLSQKLLLFTLDKNGNSFSSFLSNSVSLM